MSALVCVQCGEAVETLYVEFSPTNIRLTRCSKCGKVADKYVEYELLLVLLDTVLHRKPAVRHLLYNRMSDSALQKSIRWIPLGSLVLHCALRVHVLEETAYSKSSALMLLHLVGACLLDQIIVVIVCGIALYLTPSAIAALSKQNKSHVKLYLAAVSPELLRGFALLLQVFDSGSTLLFLFAILVLSIQFLSFQCLTNIRTGKLFVCAACVVALRVALKYAFYTQHDITRLGFLM